MKIEESIKNLKEIIDCGYDKNTTAVLDYIDIKSLEIVLNKLKELDDDLYSANCIINEQIYLLRDSINKDKIKDILKELIETKYEIEKDINNAKLMKEDINYIKDLKWQLTRQNAKIDIIEKLLEDK